VKTYRLSFIKNIKRGFLTIPLGLITLFADFIIIKTGFTSTMSIVFLVFITLYGLPGLLIHVIYVIRDWNVMINFNSKDDYIDIVKNGKAIRVYKDKIECIDKITRDGLMGKIPWWSYKTFIIKLKNGNRFSITNLIIDSEELFEIVKIKDRQLNICNKFRWI
jgi:hypothetical protein